MNTHYNQIKSQQHRNQRDDGHQADHLGHLGGLGECVV